MPDLGGKSKLVSGKAWQLIIEGVVPIELAELAPDMIAASIIQGITINLGIMGTITHFNCKLLQHIPSKSQGQ